jgi:hypothetical protein
VVLHALETHLTKARQDSTFFGVGRTPSDVSILSRADEEEDEGVLLSAVMIGVAILINAASVATPV